MKTEAKEANPPAPTAPDKRVGFAIVGLGRLSLHQILPALSECKHARVTALVSGNRDKGLKVAQQYGVNEKSVYNYENYDKLADNPDVQVIYIVLPNSMHAEYTIRGAKAGKHILCEKPMANTVADCQQMVDVCKAANLRLMIAYRQQYEPCNRAIVKMVKEGKLGTLHEFIAVNSQNQGEPNQWRLKRQLSGGGPLPDIGIYCLNAARFLSGSEPESVMGQIIQAPDDPRFKEVEASVQFMLRFPGGFTATCSTSYNTHRSQFLRIIGSDGWAEMNPAFAYEGMRLSYNKMSEGTDLISAVQLTPKNQFAQEMDHMAQCVQTGAQPHTPGEEGMQDMRIIEAIYNSAQNGRTIELRQPSPTRGPEPADS
ncbi:MAG: Gfo/Idh/MocA family protein [Candidatus Methylacidiphilales bacterium]|nr:Gfo/Idh/MocA family oxidoreductase [Candidatus Methylacidiphilales bacterium]